MIEEALKESLEETSVEERKRRDDDMLLIKREKSAL